MVETAKSDHDLHQGIDLVLPAHRAEFEKSEAGVHGQNHDGAEQDEEDVGGGDRNGFHGALQK